MALRDKLRERVTPRLEPGEQLQQVFMSQTGVSPWFIPVFGAWIALIINKYRVVAVTDRNLVVFRAGKLVASKIKSTPPERLPLQPIEVAGKLWGTATLSGTKHYIHRRFFADCAAVTAAR